MTIGLGPLRAWRVRPRRDVPRRPAPTPPEPPVARRVDVAALLALALCALLLHRDGLVGGPAFYERDTQLFYFPLADWVSRQLHAGVYPLWLPDIFTGYPIQADGEMGLLYLPQLLLLALLPATTAMVWLRVLHGFVAALFAYAFFRTVRLRPVASLGGALVFAFGSFLTAQMHHENVVRSAVWLPLVLTCVERALRQIRLPRCLAWLALAALAFAQAALGVHVQPVLMLALAVGGYALFRIAVGPRPWHSALAREPRASRRTLAMLGLAIGGPILGGLAVAAAQWLPLGEWALASFRRGGVEYEFASAFGLAPENLATIIFPFFFRLPDRATWWSLWQQWETELYVGIPTLALGIVGIAFSRRREVLFFLLLGALSLWVGMAHYAPLANLHQLLWSVPGFSFLRAPGRFSYLVVFSCAGLAALGLHALGERRLWGGHRLAIALLGALPPVACLAALLAVLPAWRDWLLADPARGRSFMDATYLATRAQYPIDPGVAYSGLVASLDLGNPKTAWSLGLLGLTAALFVVWLGLGPGRAAVGQTLFVGLLGVDLLVFAADFHPAAPLASLAPTRLAGVAAGDRVFLPDPTSLPDLAPDSLVAAGVDSVGGYSSLPSQRHVELNDLTQVQPSLVDLWSAGEVVEATSPPDEAEVGGVRFRGQHPLASVAAAAATALFRAPPELGPVSAVRLVGSLSYAFDVPQGTNVASIIVTDRQGRTTTLPLRAGVELAERAIDRPSLQALLGHGKPPGPTALDFEETTPEGEDYQAHLYQAELPLPGGPSSLVTVAVRADHPPVATGVNGLGLVSAADGTVASLSLADRDGFRLVQDDGGRRVLVTTALPRAYVVGRESALSPGSAPNVPPVLIVAGDAFDPRRNVLVEGDRSLAAGPGAAAAPAEPRPAQLERLGPNGLRVTAEADRPSYLVVTEFYHRGWAAWVDGAPAPVYIANALFRAVPLEPGRHVVEMRFQPLSLLVGAGVSAVSLAAAVGVALWGFTRRRSL